MPVIRCGENRVPGGRVYGFGFSGTKAQAKRAAITMAGSIISALWRGQVAALRCPKDCPRRAAEGVVNLRNREIVSVRVLPGLWHYVVETRYDLVLVCK